MKIFLMVILVGLLSSIPAISANEIADSYKIYRGNFADISCDFALVSLDQSDEPVLFELISINCGALTMRERLVKTSDSRLNGQSGMYLEVDGVKFNFFVEGSQVGVLVPKKLVNAVNFF